jgi:hypothetical protein
MLHLNQTCEKADVTSKARKKPVAVIGLILILITAATLMTLPTTHAVDRPTYAFICIAPSTVGVNQAVTVNMWLDRSLPTWEPWHGYTLTITKPDGTTETTTLDSYSDATAWVTYTPASIGKYSFKFSFPGQTFGADYYLPSSTKQVTLTVQAEPVPYGSVAPLPTEYWERPIEAENREWYTVSGNWFGVPTMFGYSYAGVDCFSQYNSAPNSAHIVWTKEIEFGGVVGGEYGGYGYYTGLSYETKWNPPVILNGRLYYN